MLTNTPTKKTKKEKKREKKRSKERRKQESKKERKERRRMKKRKKKEEKKEKKYPVINGIIFLRPEVLEEDIRALPGLGVDSIDDGVQRQVQLLQCGYHRDF